MRGTPCGAGPTHRRAGNSTRPALSKPGPRPGAAVLDTIFRSPSGTRGLRWLKKEALPLLAMLGLLLAARDTLANHYSVPSGSMQPTLQPGDRVIVDMRAYGLRLPFTSYTLLASERRDAARWRSSIPRPTVPG